MAKWVLILKIIIKFILPPFHSLSKTIEKICIKELEKNSEHQWALWFLGNLYVWQGNYVGAMPLLENLISMGSKNTEVYRFLVNVYFKLQKYKKINELAYKFDDIKLKKQDVTNYYIGSSLVALGVDLKRAIGYLDSYIQSNPNSFEAYEMMGLAYYGKMKYDTALVFFKQAEKLKPNNGNIKERINSCLQNINKSVGRDNINLH
jgi:tetratricopeptide (TPR) repeat protein